MARKTLTARDEAQLVADALANRDDESVVPKRSNIRVAADASAVLSVRMPIDQVRALREVAQERLQSLSELVQSAVTSLIAAPQPQIGISEATRRVVLFNITASSGASTARASGSRIFTKSAPSATTK